MEQPGCETILTTRTSCPNCHPKNDHLGPDNSVAFTQDGSHFITWGDDRVRMWDSRTGGELRTLTSDDDLEWVVSFNRDGSRVIASGAGTARILDTTIGTEVFTLRGAGGAVFSPDGSRVASREGNGVLLWESAPVNWKYLSREPAPPPRLVKP